MSNLLRFRARRVPSVDPQKMGTAYRSDTVYGERVTQIRELQGVSLADFAMQLGVTEEALRAYEAGEQVIDPELLARIGAITGFPVAFFCHPIPESVKALVASLSWCCKPVAIIPFFSIPRPPRDGNGKEEEEEEGARADDHE